MSTINCCFDWFKFVIPFCTSDAYVSNKHDREDVFKILQLDYPDLSPDEINQIIAERYPSLAEIKYYKAKDEDRYAKDDELGVSPLLKIKTSLERIFHLESLINNEFSSNLKSTFGFKYMIEYSPGIAFFYDGPEMDVLNPLTGKTRKYKTCCFELKGSGCRKVEELGVDLISTVKNIKNFVGCHATRIDYAIDIINDDKITFDYLFDKFLKKEFTTSFRKFSVLHSYDLKCNCVQLSGTTITFGSNSSTSKLNIYDKKAERLDNVNLDVGVESWIRFEVQCFNEKADKSINYLLANSISDSFCDFCSGLLLDHINIRTNVNIYNMPSFSSKRVKTWPTDPLWSDFLGNVNAVKLKSQSKFESDFVRTRKWYDRNVMSTEISLDLLFNAFPLARIDTINQKLSFLEKIDNKQINIINQYLKKNYDSDEKITFEDIQAFKDKLKDDLERLNNGEVL